MKVLVAVASKHGGTREIAREIAEELRSQDLAVDLREAEDIADVEGYDAVILGSAVYAGHWLEPARDLATRHAAALAARPTWLFSSGPIGGKPPPEDAADVAAILAATKARDHRVIGGMLDKRQLGFAKKAIVLALRVPEGDFRGWVRTIAADLRSAQGVTPSPGRTRERRRCA